ncbi:MAG: polyprenyl synthetase family protein, partial [Firmicutes bacterium]|nr:polyprenyl synthetase family protein [Bacillota bacterium]
AGDGLLTEAFYLMAVVGAYVPAPRVLTAIAHAADLAGINGMVKGQTFDIEGEEKELSLDDLKAIHRDKTGALIRLSLMSAAILAGAGVNDIEKLSEYGHYLGLAFQIEDDILDHESTFEELGKPIGSDEENGKTTYITLLGLEGAKKAAAETTEKAKAALQGLSVDAAILAELADEMLTRKK